MTSLMPAELSATVATLDGSSISGSILGWGSSPGGLTPHSWNADANGLFHTVNLHDEWQGLYQQMLAGAGATLTAVQRLEGNAEAVVENTLLSKLDPTKQQAFREDAQREYDAIAAAMRIDQTGPLAINTAREFDTRSLSALEHTLQGNETLEELALQGHGLNDPPVSKYDGFTTDFQNKVDGHTLYVGGGADNAERAVSNFFDDVLVPHVPFPIVAQNGVLEQLNQNGAVEDTAADTVAAANESMFTRVFVASDFSVNPAAQGAMVTVAYAPGTNLSPAAPTPVAGGITTLDGNIISPTIASSATDPVHGLTPHVWVADSTGLFHTATNLATEWQGYYQTMLGGQGGALTPIQRLEGNAEAVFENTGLHKLSSSHLQVDREDVQRELDAIAGAMRIDAATLGIDPAVPLTVATYLQIEHTIQSSPVLAELGLQGHGLNQPPATRYEGFTNDLQNNVDNKTLYVGGGLNNGTKALANFFDDSIITHLVFPAVMRNGAFVQLNQNGAAENPVADAVAALDAGMYTRVYVAADFNTSSTAQGPVVSLAGIMKTSAAAHSAGR